MTGSNQKRNESGREYFLKLGYFFKKTFFLTNFSNFLLQTLLILVSIAGVVLGLSPALLRSIIEGGKKFAAPRAARRSSGFSQS